MCLNFDSFDSKNLVSYQKILWICSLGYKNVLNFTWYTKNFHNHNHTTNIHSQTIQQLKYIVWLIISLKFSSWVRNIHQLLPIASFWGWARLWVSTSTYQKSILSTRIHLWFHIWLERYKGGMYFIMWDW